MRNSSSSNSRSFSSSTPSFDHLAAEMEDDALQVDSPEQDPVDEIDDEEIDDLHLPATPSPAVERANPFDSHRHVTTPSPNGSNPVKRRKSKLVKPKEKPRKEQLDYPQALPYEAESIEEMDRRLEEIVRRLIDCVKAKDYDVGFVQWNHRLECWLSLKYPMKRDLRAKLAKLYFDLCVLPGMDARLVDLAVNQAITLLEPKKRIDISDLQLPWRPIYAILEKELFPKQRKTGITNVSTNLLALTEYSQRFFPPHEIPSMLATFLPRLSPTLNSVLATQAFCTHFLPTSHPQYYLPAIFKLWSAFNSEIYDEQFLDFAERLSFQHLDPRISHPDIIEELREIMHEKGEYVDLADKHPKLEDLLKDSRYESTGKASEEGTRTPGGSAGVSKWKGIRKDVGIFTDQQFAFIMTKCLRTMGVPVGGGTKAGAQGVAATDFATSDSSATGVALTMKRPAEKLSSFAAIIVYSMSNDSSPSGSTPLGSKVPSRAGSPAPGSKANSHGLLGVATANLTKVKKDRTFLGGSKALDALAKLIQATESFFHPSNYGRWAPMLGRFLQSVTWEFLKRWKEEERAECKTPHEWRLTLKIRREFVKTMRTVALLSMFSRDPITIANAQSALKTMAQLEPDLIFPPLLERAYPALETLTETHRTTAAITALSTVSPILVSRGIYPGGAKHLLPLLDLCLPGLDVNDPIKTMSTGIFVLQACSQIVVDDLTRPEVQPTSTSQGNGAGGGRSGTPMTLDYNGEERSNRRRDTPSFVLNGEGVDGEGGGEGDSPKLSRQEEDDGVRTMTAGFPDWVSSFFRGVLAVFDALPEPGKGNKSGGKMEDQMTQTLTAACDFLCGQLSDPLFDLALDIVHREVTSNVRSNSARVVSQLVSCFARANSKKTLAKFFKLCDLNIRMEIEGGAGSTRTTTTNVPIESDTTLHHWIGLLTGAVTNSGEELLRYKNELKSLLLFLVEHSKSERSYTTSAKILALACNTLSNTWIRDYRSVNADEWNSETFKQRHHETWGRLYEAKQVKVEWHVASQEEIDFTIELLREIVSPALDRLDELLDQVQGGQSKSQEWTNDFCRFCNVVRSALAGISSLALFGPPKDLGLVASDAGDEVPEFIDHLPACTVDIPLQDPNDPRYQFVLGLRERAGQLFHRGVQTLKATAGQESSIDAVKMLISSIRVLELDYPCDHNHYAAVKKSYEFSLNISRTTRNQREFPRFVWVRRASLYQASRMRLNSFYRKRSKLDDLLIQDLCDLSLSVYLQVRRSAQRGLDSMIHFFDGTRSLIYDRLFDALKPGTDHDVMKGALYVLGSKATQNLAILDWRFGPRYLHWILQCSHQERPSVQNLIKTITHDFIIRVAEPSTLKATVESEALNRSAEQLEQMISVGQDDELLAKVSAKAQQRIEQKNEAYDDLLPQLLSLAQDPSTHWRYSLLATRLLRVLIRRDQPQRPAVAAYMARQLISELPNQRTHAMLAAAKILHFIKLRTMSGGSSEKLLLQQTSNPLRRKVDLPHPLPEDFTENFISSFSEPLTPQTRLMDKQNTGWLVWGDSLEYYVLPEGNEAPFEWDVSSKEAIETLREIIVQASWWETFIKHLAMEKTVDYLAADVITIVKSIFQVFEDAPCEFVLPALADLVADKEDRHKQRAAGELIGGMVRGSKHWPMSKQKVVWDWLTPRLPAIFEGITPETQIAWEMCAEYILNARDPRRNQPLVDYFTSLSIDKDSSEAFNVAKKQDLVGTALKALGWHFSPWAPKFIEMYSDNIAHQYQEVRSATADNLRSLCELRLHPSYGSVEQLLRDSHAAENTTKDLLEVDDAYIAMIEAFGKQLAEWRAVRKPAAESSQIYDRASMTILTWIWGSISDTRISTAFPFIMKLLPEFFRMQESTDNPELSRTAARVLLASSALQFPQHMAKQLMKQFIALLRDSSSWRVRLDVLLPLQVFYYHHLYLLDDELVAELMDQLCDLLRDPKIEVREASASTLSGIVRCSQRSAIVSLSNRFLSVLRSTKIPKRRDANGNEVAGYQEALIAAHSAVLGVSSLIKAFPYEVPPFIPKIMIETMSKHSASPPPLSTTVRATLADFKRTHQDGWETDQKAFTVEQLADLHDLLTGSSYYA
ncbi:proteasome activator BLM10 [Sporobolomyces salmoneus]|uniref:proteasome activator BLM10 n=1 Tax=Sporobolomyces salmoneus TaxID=183962 RepID=UPI003177A935